MRVPYEEGKRVPASVVLRDLNYMELESKYLKPKESDMPTAQANKIRKHI